MVSRFALWTLPPYILGLLVSPFSWASGVLYWHPFPVATTLVPLLGLMIAVPLLVRLIFRQEVRRWLLIGAALYFFWTGWGGFQQGFERVQSYPEGGRWRSGSRTRDLYDVCHWIRENTPEDAIMIASPRLDPAMMLCRRAVVVGVRSVPSAPGDVSEWHRRLVDFNGGRTPTRLAFLAAEEIEENFYALSRREYRQLGRKYDGSILLMLGRGDVGLPKLYQNNRWTVYRLGPRPAPAGRGARQARSSAFR